MGLHKIKVDKDIIHIDGMSNPWDAYTMFRKTILDGELPLWKPIGLYINAPNSCSSASAISREKSCQEAVISIATNVANLIFTGQVDSVICTEEAKGPITSGSACWKSRGKYGICRPINPDQYILTAIQNVSVELCMNKAAGYHSMEENAMTISDAKYFPLNTTHSLIDYVSVLPFTGGDIRVRYSNGMTPELLQELWDCALV